MLTKKKPVAFSIRLYERRLFKMIGELSLSSIKNLIDYRRLYQADDDLIRKWEELIAEAS